MTVEGYIDVPEADLTKVKAALAEHLRLTRAEPGCLRFEVTPSEQSNRFDVFEVFADQAAFDRHQTRVKQSDWGKITQNVKRHYQIS